MSGRTDARSEDRTDATAPVPTPTSGARVTGEVVRVKDDKGFGFVKASNGQEYFFHHSNCTPGTWQLIKDGKIWVTFEPTTTSKGPRAMLVTMDDSVRQ